MCFWLVLSEVLGNFVTQKGHPDFCLCPHAPYTLVNVDLHPLPLYPNIWARAQRWGCRGDVVYVHVNGGVGFGENTNPDPESDIFEV